MSDGCPVCGAPRDGWPLCEECTRLVREAADHDVVCGCYACDRYTRAKASLDYATFADVIDD